MPKLFLLILTAIPMAADPLFHLYDCSGREAVCTGLFPGEAAPWEGPFDVDGRQVVNGYDLGFTWIPGDPYFDGRTYYSSFLVMAVRGTLAIGYEFCCDGDGDGHHVTWRLEGATA